MKKIGILALNAFRENIWSRIFILVLLFGGVFIYFSLILGFLAVDQEIRVLMDVGLALIELMTLVATLYASATLFLREIETKTIYLILTRPLTRRDYLLGRVLGLILSTFFAILMMSILHVAILLTQGWHWDNSYPLALLGILLKMLIASALAVFFALSSTSAMAAILFSGALWAMGHFAPEMRFMALHSRSGASAALLNAVSYIIPNFQILNWRDHLTTPALVWKGIAYSLSYSVACLSMSWIILRKKEF